MSHLMKSPEGFCLVIDFINKMSERFPGMTYKGYARVLANMLTLHTFYCLKDGQL